jgi:hypothetical protein
VSVVLAALESGAWSATLRSWCLYQTMLAFMLLDPEAGRLEEQAVWNEQSVCLLRLWDVRRQMCEGEGSSSRSTTAHIFITGAWEG